MKKRVCSSCKTTDNLQVECTMWADITGKEGRPETDMDRLFWSSASKAVCHHCGQSGPLGHISKEVGDD